eukprot:3716649-Pyramimonas_sp.AAC.1
MSKHTVVPAPRCGPTVRALPLWPGPGDSPDGRQINQTTEPRWGHSRPANICRSSGACQT